MTLGYVTADTIGAASGGGCVTAQELQALKEFSSEQTLKRRDPSVSSIQAYGREALGSTMPEPWKWDYRAVAQLQTLPPPRFVHFYSGTWPTTIPYLKSRGIKTCITIAAHDKQISREEHEKLGVDFAGMLPHLTDPKQWSHYIEGYRQADVIICPSTVAVKIVREYGPEFASKDIRVIPHGCTLPETVRAFPPTFTVGYTGVLGVDKGVRYLLEAWKRLDYRDGSTLILGGRDAGAQMGRWYLEKFGGGNVHLAGWANNVSDFYNKLSLYVQPSATEGFGLEVLEALAHGRPVVCSDGAGAVDVVRQAGLRDIFEVKARNVDDLAAKIDQAKQTYTSWSNSSWIGHTVIKNTVNNYTWDKVRQQYKQVWEDLL